MYPLLKLLTTAQRHQLANPHITTVLPDQTTIKIVLSKKYAGSVNIYDKFSREYLAFIKADGTLFKMKVCTDSVFKEILALHKDPDLVNTLAVNGRRVGWCCFCGLHLTNAISVFHGYGPICAGKYELPWEGEAVQEARSKQTALEFDDDII
jgi:hypothetical protein